MTYLITGGCGFVGSNLAGALIAAGHEPVLIDNLSRLGSERNLAWLRSLGPVTFIHADIRNSCDVATAIEKLRPRTVFHLAGQVAMTTSQRNPRRDFETNVLGTINLLEAIRVHAPQAAVIYASSNKVYGNLDFLQLKETPMRYEPSGDKVGVDETAALDFRTPYGCSKGAADQYMLDYHRTFGLNTLVFRHSTIYGGRQLATFNQGWVGWFCRQALEIKRDPEREPFTISGDGKQVRDLLHVRDAVAAYLAAETSPAGRGRAFNIGGGIENSMSLLELFAKLEQRLNIQMNYRRLDWPQDDQKYFVADNSNAAALLDWKPSVANDDGLNDILAWEETTMSKSG